MDVFKTACRRAGAYRSTVAQRNVAPSLSYTEMLARFDASLPEDGKDPSAVIEELADLVEPGLMQMTHPRFFGWVIGGSAPVNVAADWLVSAWGQNTAMDMSSPATSAAEAVAATWLLDLLRLPPDSAVGFVTGGTMGSFTCLAAARGAVLARQGWDVEEDGLFGAPPIKVFVGADVHTAVLASLRFLGIGAGRVVRVETDDQGRMKPQDLARKTKMHTGPAIIIAQAGQINTGAFDPIDAVADIAAERDGWLHVDGAFGLWARAVPELEPLTRGIERADSSVTDGHKWLQLPFDTGFAIVRDRDALQSAMAISASYLPQQHQDARLPSYLVPELSRRARGVPTWAALRSLGRSGVRDMVRDHCAMARDIADRLGRATGVTVMNEVVLNQVILRFGFDHETAETRKSHAQAVITLLQQEGAVFVGGAEWRGEWVMRVSIISCATASEDIGIAAQAIISAWDRVQAHADQSRGAS